MATLTESAAHFAAELVRVFAGLLIWAAQFTVVYGVTALACARHFADVTVLGIDLVPLSIAIATLLALLATGLVLTRALRNLRETRRGPAQDETGYFLSYTTASVAGLSLVAIAWNGLPALIIPACG